MQVCIYMYIYIYIILYNMLLGMPHPPRMLAHHHHGPWFFSHRQVAWLWVAWLQLTGPQILWRKNGVSCQSEIWTAGSFSTWKGSMAQTPLDVLVYPWPRKQIHRTFRSGSPSMDSRPGVYIFWFRLFYLIVYLHVYILYIYDIYIYCTCTHADTESALKYLNNLDV